MKTEYVIKCNTDNIEFGYFDGSDNWVETSPSNFEVDASELGISVQLLRALHFFAEDISERLHVDFVDTWRRIDKLEEPND